MQLSEDSRGDAQTAMKGCGVRCAIGPFAVHLRSAAPGFARTLALLYEGIPIELDPLHHFNDFRVSLDRPRSPYRRYLRPQVSFEADSDTP